MIFSKLRIYHRTGDEAQHHRLLRLEEILYPHPEIFGYIQDLHFVDYYELGADPSDEKYDQFLLRELRKMRSLRSLRIKLAAWWTLHPKTRSLLIKLIRSCPLRALSLETCCQDAFFPVHVLGEVATLQHLKFVTDPACCKSHQDRCHEKVEGEKCQAFPSSGDQKKFSLNSFHFGGAGASRLVDYLFSKECPIQLTDLRELAIHGTTDFECATVVKVAELAGESLASLIWVSSPYGFGRSQAADLSAQWGSFRPYLISLRYLTLVTFAKLGVRNPFSLLSACVQIQTEWLEELNLIYHCDGDGITKSSLVPSDSSQRHNHDQGTLEWKIEKWKSSRKLLELFIQKDDIDFNSLVNGKALPHVEKIRLFVNRNGILRGKYPRQWTGARFWKAKGHWATLGTSIHRSHAPVHEYLLDDVVQFINLSIQEWGRHPTSEVLPPSGPSRMLPPYDNLQINLYAPSMYKTQKLFLKVGNSDDAHEILESVSCGNGFWIDYSSSTV